MNKKSITGLVLIFAIFILYIWWVSPSEEERLAMQARHDSIVAAYNDSVANAELLKAEAARLDSLAKAGDTAAQQLLHSSRRVDMGAFNPSATGDTITLSVTNQSMHLEFANTGAQISKVILSDYTTYDSLPLELISPAKDNLSLVFSTDDNRVINTSNLVFTPFVDGKPATQTDYTVAEGDSLTISMRAFIGDSNGIDNNRYLEFLYIVRDNDYNVNFDICFHNLDGIVRPTPYMDLRWNNSMNRQEQVDKSSKGSRNRNKDAERFNSNIYFKPVKDKADELRFGRDDQKQIKTSVEWVAFKQQFFCAIIMADSSFENADLALTTNANEERDNYLCDMGSTLGLSYHGGNSTMGMNFYFGPSKYKELRAMHRGFERMLPLGWGFFLTHWVSRYVIIPVFNFLERFNWNYGIIILVLTFLLRLVLFPLTFKSYQGSAIMRILKPEMDALNAKYPNQDQALQKSQEMQRLQRKAGYSPMAGCLPALIQMPILFAMFRFFPASIELRQKGFLWCHDLSTYDSVLDFGFNIPLYGDHISLFCLLMFGVQFFYTWYMMKSQNSGATMPGMKFMMYFMPFMMLFMFNSQSAALNLYYFTSLSITMIQMILIRKFTSEQKVRARMAAYDLKAKKGGPQKKSAFARRLEEMQKQMEEMQKQQNRR